MRLGMLGYEAEDGRRDAQKGLEFRLVLFRAAGAAQRFGGALADVAEAGHRGDLAGHHHVGAAADSVYQAFAAAVLVVELRLRHRIVHVDGRERQGARLLHLVERSEEHTSELQSLMRISYAVFCLKKK